MQMVGNREKMGIIIRAFEEEIFEVKEFRQMLSSCYAVQRRKDEEEFHDQQPETQIKETEDEREKLVCVTSGASFVGLAIVNRLLLRGYSVRVLVTNEEEMEKLRGIKGVNMDNSNGTSMLTAVTANINDVQSLSEAFNGCRGLFYTADFVDPAGLSGYSKAMVDIELKTCENVMEACARTSSVRSCVLTSSLLPCIWREDTDSDHLSPAIINHRSWTDESVCLKKKVVVCIG